MDSILQVAIVVLSTGAFWTYLHNKDKVIAQIINYMEHHDDFAVSLNKQVTKLNKEFFSGKALYRTIADE